MKKRRSRPHQAKQSSLEKLQGLLQVVSRGKYMWESTFDAIQDTVLVIGPDYRIERANIAAAERSDHDVRELIGKKCYRIFARRKRVCPGCPLQQTLRTKHPQSVVIDHLRVDGDFAVNSYPLLQGTKRSEYRVVHHYRDVTDEKVLQRKLVQSEKMAAIGMLAGGVAHEINNPLGGVLAFTQLLQRELPSDSPAQSDLAEIEGAAKRCKKIVQDLLTFSRPTQEGDKGAVKLNDLFDKILTLTRLHLRSANIDLVLDLDPSLPMVWGDPTRLQQVTVNLITNAIDSMKGGGQLTIRTSHRGSEIYMEVIDTGCGIKREHLNHIFDPFFTTKGPQEGTGLGLSICYAIVREHHGRMEVKSNLGKGTKFTIALPKTAVTSKTSLRRGYGS